MEFVSDGILDHLAELWSVENEQSELKGGRGEPGLIEFDHVSTVVGSPPRLDLFGDRFEVAAGVASGGGGTVYKTYDRQTKCLVALKAVHVSTDDENARFEREASTLASIDHPNIVRYVAHGAGPGGSRFLVTELVEGASLAVRLGGGPLPLSEVEDLALAIAAGLGALHARGLVHRDVKPGNIIVGRDGIKLIDFGLVRVPDLAVQLTAPGQRMGSLTYLAPEQASGEVVSASADVFSFGCTLAHALQGSPPRRIDRGLKGFMAATQEVDPSTLPTGISPRFEELVRMMTASNPSRRPQNGQELLGELLRVTGRQAAVEDLPASTAANPSGVELDAVTRRRRATTQLLSTTVRAATERPRRIVWAATADGLPLGASTEPSSRETTARLIHEGDAWPPEGAGVVIEGTLLPRFRGLDVGRAVLACARALELPCREQLRERLGDCTGLSRETVALVVRRCIDGVDEDAITSLNAAVARGLAETGRVPCTERGGVRYRVLGVPWKGGEVNVLAPLSNTMARSLTHLKARISGKSTGPAEGGGGLIAWEIDALT